MLRKVVACFLVILFVFIGGPGPLSAVSGAQAASESALRINLAGRQRMLSQRMAKAMCFAALGVDQAGHVEMAAIAHGDFERVLSALRNGDAELGLSSESDPNVLSALDDVDELWEKYGHAVDRGVQSENVDPWILAAVNSYKLPTLVQMNEAVTEIVQVYATGDVPPELAQTINVAGRQRMLSQKATAEFCLIVQGLGSRQNREALGKTLQLFNASLSSLQAGTEGMVSPPSDILTQLEYVEELWAPLSEIFVHVSSGGLPNIEQVKFAAERNNLVLVEMNRAVGMYGKIATRPKDDLPSRSDGS